MNIFKKGKKRNTRKKEREGWKMKLKNIKEKYEVVKKESP